MLNSHDDVDLVIVTFTEPKNLRAYQERHNLASTSFIVDPGRSAYRAFGLGRGAVTRIWGLRAAKRYLEIFRDDSFSRPGRPTEDTLQLGGDFIIDPEGTIVYGFWGEGPDDRRSAESIRDALVAAELAT